MTDDPSTLTPRRRIPETKEGKGYRRWRPVYHEKDTRLSPPFDWICPVCNMNIDMPRSGRMICPSCGLLVGQNPASPKPYPIKMRQLRRFAKQGR